MFFDPLYFAFVLPPLLLWMVWRLGYDKRSPYVMAALALVILPLSYLFGSPERNLNWAYGFGEDAGPLLPGFAGVLDGAGCASFQLVLPPGTAGGLAGQDLTVAAALALPDGRIVAGSSPVQLAVEP